MTFMCRLKGVSVDTATIADMMFSHNKDLIYYIIVMSSGIVGWLHSWKEYAYTPPLKKLI